MKKLTGKSVYGISKFSEDKYLLISRGRALIINKELEIEFTSPHLTNMNGMFRDTENDCFIYYNTVGKCVFTKSFEQDEICKIFTAPDADFPIAVCGKNYIFIDKNRKLKLLDTTTQKKTPVETDCQPTHIFNYQNKYILVAKLEKDYYLLRCSFDGKKMICENKLFILSDHPTSFKRLDEQHLAFLGDENNQTGFNKALYVVDLEEMTCYAYMNFKTTNNVSEESVPDDETTAKIDDVEKYIFTDEKSGQIDFDEKYIKDTLKLGFLFEQNEFIPEQYSISPDGEHFALIDSDTVQVRRTSDGDIIYNEAIQFGSDVQWINDSDFLIGTWSGLYLDKITAKKA